MARTHLPVNAAKLSSWLIAAAWMLCIGGLLYAAGQNSSAAAEESEEVHKIGPGVTPPQLIHRVEPVRPNGSQIFKVKGSVLIGMTVTSKGLTRNVNVVQSLDTELDQACIEAVKQWKFEPAKKQDKPVAVKVTAEIRFHDM